MSDRLRLLLSMALLAALAVAMIVAGDARAWSGSDAGGKAATARYMHDRSSWTPEVGYWAEEHDPAGTFHPLIYTRRMGDRWVQVTGVPFPVAGRVLWAVAGPAGLLALPVTATVLAAASARALARRLGAATGRAAFWLVGAGSPMLFYAGDFWEHTAAVAAALASIALAVGPPGVRRAVAAGACAGAAFVFRTEAAVVLAVVGIALLTVADVRRRWLSRRRDIAGLVGAGLAVVAANVAAEVALVGSELRSGRAGELAAEAGTDVSARLRDTLATVVGLWPETVGPRATLAVVLGFLLLLCGWCLRRSDMSGAHARIALASALVVAGVVIIRMAEGPGFVPGMLMTAPVAAAALATGGSGGARRGGAAGAVAIGAAAAVPVILLLQWRGQLQAQWGGRYLLVAAALLTVAGTVAFERIGWRQPAAVVLAATAFTVSGFGAVWHAERTGAMARLVERIERAPDDVLIIGGLAHLGREAGAFYGRHRWLSANNAETVGQAGEIALAAAVPRVDVVTLDQGQRRPSLAGYRYVSERRIPFLDFRFVAWRFELVR